MAVRMVTPLSEIDAHFDFATKRINSGVTRMFCDIGDKCTTEARDRAGEASWFDDTGRLRSSVGYAVAEKGRVVKTSSFEVVRQGAEGAVEGRKLVTEIVRALNHSCSLSVGAGAPYAEEVEAMENKVVLASAELLAKRDAPKALRQLEKQLLR